MPRVTGAYSSAEIDAYLDSATVPIRLATRRPDGGLWMVALWFDRRGDHLACATGADARLVDLLEADPQVAFDVSENEPPYRGVRGSGTVSIEPDADKGLLRDLLDRYLGGTDSDLADSLLDEDREEVRLLIDPDRLHAWDYSDRMADGPAD